ncbi:hypothetical protein GCM10009663_52670 [Kitasatospora arboriphila]|uniref:Uncharacterized protein n=1 Tax=Kitasatospora arboriphila TaxID=258052 RepID=A0ABP4EG46_9ACTN
MPVEFLRILRHVRSGDRAAAVTVPHRQRRRSTCSAARPDLVARLIDDQKMTPEGVRSPPAACVDDALGSGSTP